jgi:hypothetical protein
VGRIQWRKILASQILLGLAEARLMQNPGSLFFIRVISMMPNEIKKLDLSLLKGWVFYCPKKEMIYEWESFDR